jgi:hypothetical protein
MADLLFLGVTMGFFCVCAGYVALCDRIVGIDPPPPGDVSGKSSENAEVHLQGSSGITEGSPS